MRLLALENSSLICLRKAPVSRSLAQLSACLSAADSVVVVAVVVLVVLVAVAVAGCSCDAGDATSGSGCVCSMVAVVVVPIWWPCDVAVLSVASRSRVRRTKRGKVRRRLKASSLSESELNSGFTIRLIDLVCRLVCLPILLLFVELVSMSWSVLLYCCCCCCDCLLVAFG